MKSKLALEYAPKLVHFNQESNIKQLGLPVPFNPQQIIWSCEDLW